MLTAAEAASHWPPAPELIPAFVGLFILGCAFYFISTADQEPPDGPDLEDH